MSSWLWIVVGAGFALALLVAYFSAPAQAGDGEKPSDGPRRPRKERQPSLQIPRIDYEEDATIDPTKVGGASGDGAAAEPRPTTPTTAIVYDEDAATEEPTQTSALILVSAKAQTDKGKRRKANEDSLLVDERHSTYVVADGMGGYRGGEIASRLAVETIARAFAQGSFDGPPHDNLPRRASELARAMQMANSAILAHAAKDKVLEGMGTTLTAARFSPNKQRLYLGHVGDSRAYRLRGGVLKAMTTDHTMKQHGMKGPEAGHLSRAIGVWPVVPIDIVFAKPLPDDVYLLCSDGLTKMLTNDKIQKILSEEKQPEAAVDRLVLLANEKGGLDNITAILVRVSAPAQA